MKVSELIKQLQTVLQEHGDIAVCSVWKDGYWGRIYDLLSAVTVDEHAQPEGPKSGKWEKAVVFGETL